MNQRVVLQVRRAAACLLLALLAAGCGTNPDVSATAKDGLALTADVQLGDLSWDTAIDVPAPDVPAVDVAIEPDTPQTPDIAPDVAKTDAGCTAAGCACTDNQQCDSAFCIETGSGQQCAKLCTETCADGFKCGQVSGGGGDVVNLCVPAHPRLCEPCGADSDCNNVLGGAESRCVPYKDGTGSTVGAFCGNSCSDNSACPSGYSCKEATSLGGVKGNQCQKDDLVCLCDARASNLQLTTACSNANAAGTCGGKRGCGANGLSACDAPSAVPEQCNLKDDDCDSQTDEPSAGMCDDGAVCTYDNCIAGECQHPGKPGACDDGNVCTAGDACKGGVCLAGAATACDDNNPCTTDTCDTKTGCVFAVNNLPCTDGDACTLGDVCKGGACGGIGKLPCNDGNPCTDDSCDAQTGCNFMNNVLPCDDNNGCTTGDTCKAGTCTPSAPSNCDDGNPCTTETCDVKGGCKSSNNAAPCSDGSQCTVSDACDAGKCVPGKAQACNDGNPCTDDGCDDKLGCTFSDNIKPCTDANVCTEGDLCQGGNCVPGKGKLCNDNNPCTDDACDPLKGCTAASNSAACSDGDACTLNDACSGGSCVGGGGPNCDDGNPCTDDSCDKAKGCQHAANAAPCSDANICTESDTCGGGKCLPGKGKVCNDNKPCTDDACDPQAGCVVSNNTASCSDGDACTTNDGCASGVCVGGSGPNCDDGNACTDDGCDKVKGCQHLANTAGCTDGNVCTEADACKDGKCVPGLAKPCNDGNPCTDDSCDPIKGCVTANNSAACTDGDACTVNDGCAGGGCAGGGPVNCDDGNGCTDDGCNKTKGCTHLVNTGSCSDGNLCTVADACLNGSCLPGAAKNCDDGNPCTTDSCDAVKGCLNVNNTLPCDDGSVCSQSDACANGKCAPGTTKVCNDSNDCTDDSCDKVNGCVFVANSAPCDDGSACTANDVCGGKLCAGKAISCDDSNACTTDTCVPATGCKHANLADQVDCATGKWCQSGQCVAKPFCGDGVVNQVTEQCDDGNKTSGDGCEPDCTLTPAGKKCTNGSTTDCNPAGQTLIPSSAFVDQLPPTGWTQCAGFVNTAGDDVGNTALDNCLSTTRLRVKTWDANGNLEEDVYTEGLTKWNAWPNFNYLGGAMTKLKATYWTGDTTFFTATGGNDACSFSCTAAPCGTLTLGTGNGSSAIVAPGNTNALEWRVNCGGAALVGRKIALYK